MCVVLLLSVIWYSELEGLWQVTLVDHFFSILPNHEWKSDLSVGLLTLFVEELLIKKPCCNIQY